MTPKQHRAELVKLLKGLTGKYRFWTVFEAFVEAVALSMQNSVTLHGNPRHAEREERYQRIIDLDPERADVFPQALAHLAMALEELHDALGLIFHEHDLASDDMGQFFTPYHISRFMAQLNLGSADDLKAHVEQHGHLTLHEPAAGAGGMVIAMADTMRSMGVEPQRHLHATCWELEATAAHMCFVQLSLLHIPAVIVMGNTLTQEVREVMETPARVLGLWQYKLNRRRETQPVEVSPLPAQASLFELTGRSQ